jgi:divalent metal cation (Fe/Co/Zn/Cd) transporter
MDFNPARLLVRNSSTKELIKESQLMCMGRPESASLMVDSNQTLACAMLFLALLIGLGLNYLYGIWQGDPIIGLLIAAVLVMEGYEALKEEKLCNLL